MVMFKTLRRSGLSVLVGGWAVDGGEQAEIHRPLPFLVSEGKSDDG
jgi:hypothetical protein